MLSDEGTLNLRVAKLIHKELKRRIEIEGLEGDSPIGPLKLFTTERFKLLDHLRIIDSIKSKFHNPNNTSELINVLNAIVFTQIKKPLSRNTEYKTLKRLLERHDTLSKTDISHIIK